LRREADRTSSLAPMPEPKLCSIVNPTVLVDVGDEVGLVALLALRCRTMVWPRPHRELSGGRERATSFLQSNLHGRLIDDSRVTAVRQDLSDGLGFGSDDDLLFEFGTLHGYHERHGPSVAFCRLRCYFRRQGSTHDLPRILARQPR